MVRGTLGLSAARRHPEVLPSGCCSVLAGSGGVGECEGPAGLERRPGWRERGTLDLLELLDQLHGRSTFDQQRLGLGAEVRMAGE